MDTRQNMQTSQYAMDADFIVEHLQRKGKLGQFGSNTSSDSDGLSPRGRNMHGGDEPGRKMQILRQAMSIAEKNYVILIIAVLLFIVLLGFVEISGVFADIVVGFLSFCLVFAVGSKFYASKWGVKK
jgi:hypothetical protein